MPVSDSKTHFKALQMLALATLFWGLSFPVMKALGAVQQAALPGRSSLFSASLSVTVRFAAAALIMGLWSWKTLRRLTRLEIEEGVGLGFFGGLGIILQMDGLNYTHASTSAFLTQAYCFIIPIIVAVHDRRLPSLLITLCCLLMVGGMVILSGIDLRGMALGRGEIETLGASVIFIGQILWLQRPAYAKNNVNHFTTVMFLVFALMALPVALGTMREPSDFWRAYASPSARLLTLVLILLCTMISYVLMNYWQPRVSATEAGLIYGAEPVCASLFALFLPAWISKLTHLDYPNETLTLNLLVGGGLILGANVLLQSASRPQPPSPS